LRTTIRQVMTLIGPGRGRRWLGLVALAGLVSVVEASGALLVYALLQLVTQDEGSLDVPVIGDIGSHFPGLDERQLLLSVALVIAVFFVARAGLYLTQSYLQSRVAYNTGVAVSSRLLRGYLASTYPEHLRRSSAESLRNAHESAQLLAQQVLVPGVALVSESFLLLVVFLVLLVVAPGVTGLTVLVLAPLSVLLVKGLQPRLMRFGQTAQDMSTASLDALTQTLGGFREVKVLHRESFFTQRFDLTRAMLARAFYLRSFLLDVPRVGVETGLILFILVFLAINVGEDGASDGTVTTLAFFAYAALRVLPSVNRIMVNLQLIRFGMPLISQLHADVSAADAAVSGASSAAPIERWPFERSIVLDRVTVVYDGADRPALAEIDLEIRRGEWVGIVGPTGGGKSTLVDVMIGLLPPTTGSIRVDGRDVFADPRSWHAHLGLVPQTIFLVDDTIRRNIAFGIPDEEISDEAIETAVRMARIDEWIASLPNGLDTPVGERGVKVSGGQRQRVAIARALYTDPDVIVFDEGTSALDTTTESEVIQALQGLRGGRTLVTVAHRLSTVRTCDRVVAVAGGRIVASGTYDELDLDALQTPTSNP